MDTNASFTPAALEKWGFSLQELYRLAFAFYKQNSGKAIHLSYEDNLKLIAFKQQATLGPYDAKHAPALGVLDVIGRDRQQHWQLLGNITKEQAMEGFIDLLDTMCSAFRPYIEAVKKNRDETLEVEKLRTEANNVTQERRERDKQELLEDGYKDELQKRQLQDALNKQTYQQFKMYAEKHFPGNPEQQGVLIHQLQREHYYQYMQQLHIQNQNQQTISPIQSNKSSTTTLAAVNNTNAMNDPSSLGNNNNNNNINKENVDSKRSPNAVVQLATAMEGLQFSMPKADTESVTVKESADQLQDDPNSDAYNVKNVDSNADEDDYIIIRPAKIWTRPDITQFKAEVSAGGGDGVITVGHGDTVTVRVPTNLSGKSIFWEFATDNYDIGFGIYFEWAKSVTSEVTVLVSDSDEDEDCVDEDYLTAIEDLESGSVSQDRSALAGQGSNSLIKPPISIIVPIYRRECYNEVYVGSHSYPGEGVYLLKFDNSYSIWRSKTLYYRVYYER